MGNPNKNLMPPYTYYGGKRRSADEFWRNVGDVDVYLEPFAGSLAVLLAAPKPISLEIACDIDPFVINFWRAIQSDYRTTAKFADYPSYHDDLYARHVWLIDWMYAHRQQLEDDEGFFDPQVAGWWVWGINCWVGSGWCILPNNEEGTQPYDKRPWVSSHGGGHGTSAQRLYFDYGPHIDRIGDGARLMETFKRLSERIQGVKLICGDWKKIFAYQEEIDKYEKVAVFLDPPYITTERASELYVSDWDGSSDNVAHLTQRWAIEHGDRYRIAYCAHEGDFTFTDWDRTVKSFSTFRLNQTGDEIHYSPACTMGNVHVPALL